MLTTAEQTVDLLLGRQLSFARLLFGRLQGLNPCAMLLRKKLLPHLRHVILGGLRAQLLPKCAPDFAVCDSAVQPDKIAYIPVFGQCRRFLRLCLLCLSLSFFLIRFLLFRARLLTLLFLFLFGLRSLAGLLGLCLDFLLLPALGRVLRFFTAGLLFCFSLGFLYRFLFLGRFRRCGRRGRGRRGRGGSLFVFSDMAQIVFGSIGVVWLYCLTAIAFL